MLKHKRFLLPVIVLLFSLFAPELAGATQLNQAAVRLGRLGSAVGGVGSGNDVFVSFKLKTSPTTVTNMLVTFPAGFTLTTGTPIVTAPPSGYTLPPGVTAGTTTATVTGAGAGAGGTIQLAGLTSASLNSTALYGFVLPENSVTNPTTAGGQYSLTLASRAAAVVVDSNPVQTYITASGGDQVTVNASVSPNFSFTLSGTADTIPVIDKTTVQTSTGINMKISTNAPLGYTAYVKSANAGLKSTSLTYTIPTGTYNTTPDTLTAGTSEYAFVPTSSTLCVGGCGAASPVYDGEYAGLTGGSVSSPSSGGSFNSTNFSSFVSRATYTAEDNFTLQERAAISAAVPFATDYSDTLTIVAAGNF